MTTAGAPANAATTCERCPAGRSASMPNASTNTSDVVGLVKPTWTAVMAREYEPWSREHLVVDSAKMSAERAAQLISSKIAATKSEST
jgi:hypothetical protein